MKNTGVAISDTVTVASGKKLGNTRVVISDTVTVASEKNRKSRDSDQ